MRCSTNADFLLISTLHRQTIPDGASVEGIPDSDWALGVSVGHFHEFGIDIRDSRQLDDGSALCGCHSW